ncbi:unnamed protein product [Menidia menidia]|uniref:(Atlantic silverside) hypothetical protein n=1 Tax=Menidia menidia TaxID=238744 RepID=A0A8S4BZB4_9TELE|nr:unnamed protein product [Menidia menidia]
MFSADPGLLTSLQEPSISPRLELSLTTVYTGLYSVLFVFVYLQLWLILHYGHKRLSFQSVFLFLCLLWAALRTTLFSFYFRNVLQANRLQPLAYWLLYCCPVCLQFFTLCLLNLYFTQAPSAFVLPEPRRLFPGGESDLCSAGAGSPGAVRAAHVSTEEPVLVLVLVPVLALIAKMSSANVYLESKATAIGALVILLYTSRACYNLVVVAMAPQDRPSPFNYGCFSSRAYFFDNPRRYDSDDDLSRSISSRADRARWLHPVGTAPSSAPGRSPPGGGGPRSPPPSTAPLLFAYGNIQSHHHHHHNYYSTPQNNNHHHHHSNYYSTPQNYYSQMYFCTPQN